MPRRPPQRESTQLNEGDKSFSGGQSYHRSGGSDLDFNLWCIVGVQASDFTKTVSLNPQHRLGQAWGKPMSHQHAEYDKLEEQIIQHGESQSRLSPFKT